MDISYICNRLDSAAEALPTDFYGNMQGGKAVGSDAETAKQVCESRKKGFLGKIWNVVFQFFKTALNFFIKKTVVEEHSEIEMSDMGDRSEVEAAS